MSLASVLRRLFCPTPFDRPIVNAKSPGAVNYAGTPPAYKCCVCGTSGVKLWRWYQTFLDDQRLYCVDCAIENQHKQDCAKYVHADAVREDGKSFSFEQWGDQIGWLVPAVPTEEGDTYWGYGNTPQAGCDWWRRLPLRRSE